MNRSIDPVEMAEKNVADARATLCAEFRSVREKVRHPAISPYAIGGIFLGALGLGYFAGRHFGKSRRSVRPAAPSGFLLGLEAARMALPLLGALAALRSNKPKTGALSVVLPASRL